MKVKKVYDGTSSTSSATFGTSTVTSANGLPSRLMLHLVTKLTLIIRRCNNNAVVTADAAYTISSKTHNRHGNVYGLQLALPQRQSIMPK